MNVPNMAARRRALLPMLFVCTELLSLASGAVLVSRRSALMKKRSTEILNMVEVNRFLVDCTVASRYARTVMTSSAQNHANVSKEIFFEVELPKTAFITGFTMEIDGEVYAGEVKEKEKAKKEYEKAVSSGKTSGLVKASGRKLETFSVSVNVAAQSNVTFVLTYEELIQRNQGRYEILTRVQPKQPVQDFQITVNIYEPQGTAFVEATGTFISNDLLPLVKKTVTDTKAYISFSPTLEQQRKCPKCPGTLIDGDFIVRYDVRRTGNLGEIQIVNGYFVHYFAPPDLPRVPKNVVFVIDRSGSMSGRKIEQTRIAMAAILEDVHEDDHFAIIQFDNKIITWKDSLTKASKHNVNKAIAYVRKIRDNGATNINDALIKAVLMLLRDRENGKLPQRSVDMIILLTDGMPNSGVSKLPIIQKNVREAIEGRMSLFCLGFGNDVDYSFLDVMSKQNKGLARRIFEASDVALQLQGFYEEISSPLLSEVNLHYPENEVAIVTKSNYSYLFNGSEIVVAGRLSNSLQDNFLVDVFGRGPETDFQVQGKPSSVNWADVYPDQEYIFGNFTERLWAYLTIQQLLEKRDIASQQEEKRITDRILDMSLHYNFVTPLTSLLVIKPETEDGNKSPLIADKMTEGERQKAEQMAAYPASFDDPVQSDVDGDPHFMIELPSKDDALCFNINDKPGNIFNLVRDTESGFVVNGQIIGKKKAVPDSKPNTYFGRFGIIHRQLGVRLEVSTQNISVLQDGKQITLLWSDKTSIKNTNMDLRLSKNCSLTVTLRHAIKFMVIRHTKVWRRRHQQQNYLGFYTLDSHHLSPSVHGLLGQFYHGIKYEVTDSTTAEVEKKADAIMYVKGHTLNVTRHWQRDFSTDVRDGESVSCWFVNNNGMGLVDGKAADYIVPDLFVSETF